MKDPLTGIEILTLSKEDGVSEPMVGNLVIIDDIDVYKTWVVDTPIMTGHTAFTTPTWIGIHLDYDDEGQPSDDFCPELQSSRIAYDRLYDEDEEGDGGNPGFAHQLSVITGELREWVTTGLSQYRRIWLQDGLSDQERPLRGPYEERVFQVLSERTPQVQAVLQILDQVREAVDKTPEPEWVQYTVFMVAPTATKNKQHLREACKDSRYPGDITKSKKFGRLLTDETKMAIAELRSYGNYANICSGLCIESEWDSFRKTQIDPILAALRIMPAFYLDQPANAIGDRKWDFLFGDWGPKKRRKST